MEKMNFKSEWHEIKNIEEVTDLLRKHGGDMQRKIADIVEEQHNKNETISEGVFRVAMQSLNFSIPTVKEAEEFVKKLNKK